MMSNAELDGLISASRSWWPEDQLVGPLRAVSS